MHDIRNQQFEPEFYKKEKRFDLTEGLININSKGNTIHAMNLSTEESLDIPYVKIDNEIKKLLEGKNIDISQYLYLDQIIPIVDSLNNGQIFDRVLLMHILEFGKFNKDHPIELRSFFISYFNVYDNMKSKRISYINQIIELKKSLENVKRRVHKHRNEIIYENGLTSNSCFKFCIKKLSFCNSLAEKNEYKLVVKDIHKNHFVSIILDNSIIDKKYKIKITHSDFTLCTFSFYIHNKLGDWDMLLEESLTTNNILENDSLLKFNLKSIFINSKINFYVNKINNIEQDIKKTYQIVSLIDNSLSNLEKPIVKILSTSLNDSKPNLKDKFSETIEQIASKIVGKRIIIWEKILFTLNKILLVTTLFIQVLYRSDYVTLILSSLIISIELKILKRKFFIEILKLALISIFLDILWSICYNLESINPSLYEGNSLGLIFRKVSTIFIFFIILIKLISLIALWRMYEIERYNEINIDNYHKKIIPVIPLAQEEEKKEYSGKKTTKSKFYLKPSKENSVQSVVLRDIDHIEKI